MAEVREDLGHERPLLIADGLCKSYGRQLACRDVSFSLYAGEVLAIVGESSEERRGGKEGRSRG